MSDLNALTATQLVAGYEAGDFTPVEVTRAALDCAAQAQAHLNAFVRIDTEEALAAAQESADRWQAGEPAGPVDGVPVTVKDILLQRGEATLKGSWAVDAEERPVGRGRARRSAGCARAAPSSSARRRPPSSAGRASPTAPGTE